MAALALLFASYTGLFTINAAAFLVSAGLIAASRLPAQRPTERESSTWGQITFGIRAYLKTPRLRGLLAFYMGVAAASAMVIVNTVMYVRDDLSGSAFDAALTLAAAGCGSMLVALGLPTLLDRITDRTVMLSGSVLMTVGLGLMALSPGFAGMLAIWFLIGAGWSMVQTPAGRVVNRSSAPADRPAYFSAQFSLSHACWLVFYPLAGSLGTYLGIEITALLFAFSVMVFTAHGSHVVAGA